MSAYVVAALYKFVDLPDYAQMRAPLRAMMDLHVVKGTILLAREGVNGTIAGSRARSRRGWAKALPTSTASSP